MYKDQALVDRREMLRVKIKSLACEAQIIRKEEKHSLHRKKRVFRGRVIWRGQTSQLHHELWHHRITVVRRAAREAGLAYGFIRGRTWQQMEPTCKVEPDWQAIAKMLQKYGPTGMADRISELKTRTKAATAKVAEIS